MLQSGGEPMRSDEPKDAAVGREKLRDNIHATLGFEELGRLVGKNPTSLLQIFSARGNTQERRIPPGMGALRA